MRVGMMLLFFIVLLGIGYLDFLGLQLNAAEDCSGNCWVMTHRDERNMSTPVA